MCKSTNLKLWLYFNGLWDEETFDWYSLIRSIYDTLWLIWSNDWNYEYQSIHSNYVNLLQFMIKIMYSVWIRFLLSTTHFVYIRTSSASWEHQYKRTLRLNWNKLRNHFTPEASMPQSITRIHSFSFNISLCSKRSISDVPTEEQ